MSTHLDNPPASPSDGLRRLVCSAFVVFVGALAGSVTASAAMFPPTTPD